MRHPGWIPAISLRGKIGILSIAVLITFVAVTALLLISGWNASAVIARGELTQERVRIYSELQNSARDHQGASYQSVREPSPATLRRAAETRTRLENLLSEAARLPVNTTRDQVTADRIAREGRAIITHFHDTAELVRRVDEVWKRDGSRAAMREVDLLTQPIYALKATLNTEIRLGGESMRAASGNAQGLIRRSALLALIGLGAGLVLSLLLQMVLRLRLQPGLRQLENGARALGEGELGHRIALGGSDELAALSDAFDGMAGSLAEKRQALQAAHAGLERAIAERTAELETANAQLAAADDRRRDFMADVSHELRTPLTIIRGEAQVALRTASAAPSEAHETIERILEQTYDLSRMVDDLFMIARAEAGVLPLELEPVDLRHLCASLAADFDTLVATRGGTIRTRAGGPVVAQIDRQRMRRAVATLIENALKHCPGAVQIELDVWQSDGQAMLLVCDDGPGLDFSKAQQLFARFSRGGGRGEGAGLGLSLVKALTEAHHGQFALAPGMNGGTRATITLAAPAAAQAAA